jgi:hypothetical protein
MKAGKNRYYRRSRISVAQFRELMRAFALDLTASDAAELTGLSTRRINDIYLKVRGKTAEFREFNRPAAVRLKSTSPTSGHAMSAASGDAGRAARRSSSASSNATVTSIPGLSPTPRKTLWLKRFGAKSIRRASSTATAAGVRRAG